MNQRCPGKIDRFHPLLLAGALAALLAVPAFADDTNVPVIKIAPDTDLTAFKCNKCAITLATDAASAPVLSLKLQANQGFPGFTYTPPAPLDLSAAKGVRAVVTNPGDAAISVTLKVLNTDPAAKEPWSTGAFTIGPGETRMVQTAFGQVYGNPGYKLDPKAVTGINLYVGGAPAATERTLLIKAVETFTAVVVQPPPDPGKPPNSGLILWLDASKESTATLDAARHVSVLADRSDGHHDAKAASPDAMPTLTPNQMKTRPMLHFTGKEALTVDSIRTTPGDATVFVAWVRLTGPQTPGPNPTLISSLPNANAAPDAAPNFRIPAPPTGPKDSWRSSSTITVQNAPLGPLTIGQDFAGNIQEVLVYDHVFANETERQKVYDYLAKKWNADTPPLGWLRTDPLDPAPARPHPDLPLSDQDNKGGWTLDPKFSDDFSATSIDLNRYVLSSSFHGWAGRKPGLFMPDHVSMSDGTLRLKIDKFTPEEAAAHPGWSYGTGYIRTKELTGYGYYEIEAKPAFSEFDCAFWLMDTGDAVNKQYQDELDIFEMGIHSAKFANNDYMTAHVYNTAGDGFTWATGNWYHTPWNIADAYHTYGFEWTPTEIKWYVDGNLLRELKNTDWRYPMYLIFDAEPMLDWFGPIDDKDFPAEYDIKHLKVWRQAGAVAPAAATP
jgi:beta-glucanase (GH16 family)